VLPVVELLLAVSVELVGNDEAAVGVDDVVEVVAGVDEEVVIGDALEEELEELEPGALKTAYAPIPAAATMTTTITAMTAGARPLLLRSTIRRCVQFYLRYRSFVWVVLRLRVISGRASRRVVT
jgi:hypothetical protein